MPLLDPLNDEGCLRKLHQSVSEYMQTEQARALAAQFSDVDELIELVLGRLDDLFVCMSGGGDAERRRQIQILRAVDVLDEASLGAAPNDRPACVRIAIGDVARFVVAQHAKNG